MNAPSDNKETLDQAVAGKAPLDPNTMCYLAGGVLYFHGRLDGSFPAYQGLSMNPVEAPIGMGLETFLELDMSARTAWSKCVSHAWTQTDRITGLMPFSIEDREYAKGYCVIERHPVAMHHKLVRDFLANQTENAPAVWLGNVLVGCYLTYLEKTSLGLLGKMVSMANETSDPVITFSELIASKPENFFSVTAEGAAQELLEELGHDQHSPDNVEKILDFMRKAISTQDIFDARHQVLMEDPEFLTRHPDVAALERATLDRAVAMVCNRLEQRLLKESLRDGVPGREGIVDHILGTLTGPGFLKAVPADIVLGSVIS